MRHLCAVIATTLVASSSHADTINVPGDYPTIQEAIDAAAFGDTIQIAAGTYYENLVINQKDAIGITLQGERNRSGVLETIIDGQQIYTAIRFSGASNIELKDLVVTGGSAPTGGGITIHYSDITITDCEITDNASQTGGGIRIYSKGSLTISDCTITGNSATQDGGGIYVENNSNLYISNCFIASNTADENGGGICSNNCPVTVRNCTIKHNIANTSGGGIYCSGIYPHLLVSESSVNYNTATAGGGIFTWSANSSIFTCEFSNNTNHGFYSQYGFTTISGCMFLGNTAFAIMSSQDLQSTISNCFVNGNGSRGIICAGESGIVANCEISTHTGPGIECSGGSHIITGCTVTDNTYGIQCFGADLIIAGSRICGNTDYQIYGTWTDGVIGSPNIIATSCALGACCMPTGCLSLTSVDCDTLGGTWLGEGGSCDDCAATCNGDVNTDGTVDVLDLLDVIAAWGNCL